MLTAFSEGVVRKTFTTSSGQALSLFAAITVDPTRVDSTIG